MAESMVHQEEATALLEELMIKKPPRPCTDGPAAATSPEEQPTFICYGEGPDDQSKDHIDLSPLSSPLEMKGSSPSTQQRRTSSKRIKRRTGRLGRRSLSNVVVQVQPPLGESEEAYPPEETGLVNLYPPLEMEGFPTSETYFYHLRYQEAAVGGGRSVGGGGPFAYLAPGQSGSSAIVGEGALAILMVAVCGVLYMLFRKRSCFINCGWKDIDDDSLPPGTVVPASRILVTTP